MEQLTDSEIRSMVESQMRGLRERVDSIVRETRALRHEAGYYTEQEQRQHTVQMMTGLYEAADVFVGPELKKSSGVSKEARKRRSAARALFAVGGRGNWSLNG